MTLKLTSLELTNFRRFAKLHVDFHPEVTVLIAPNGGGKTAILDAIALVLYQDSARTLGSPGKRFKLEESDHRREPCAPESTLTEKAMGQVCVFLTGVPASGHSGQPRTAMLVSGYDEQATVLMNVAHHAGTVRRLEEFESLPVMAYYGVDRRLKSDAVATDPAEAAGARYEGYRGSLESAANYQRFLDLFAQWYRITSDAKIRAMENGREYEPGEFDGYMSAVREAVNTCLAGTGWGSLNFSVTLQSLTVVHETMGEQQVGMLSEGIRSVLAMAADIAHRCVVLNPHLGAEACNSPGVVLIDELDLHLHPEWQQRIVEALRTAFPNIQFIVTTHSPQLLTTVTADQIRVLPDIGSDLEHAERPEFNPLARSAGDALTRVMGIASKPSTGLLDGLALELERYEYELRRGRSDSQRALKAKAALDAAGYEFEPADLATWKRLGIAARADESPGDDSVSAADEAPANDA